MKIDSKDAASRIESLLERLCAAPGSSFAEDGIREIISGLVGPGCEMSTDALGSLTVRMGRIEEAAPVLLLDAHIDEISMIITEVTGEGFLRFAPLGGVDRRVLPAARVDILCEKPMGGVITSAPPHLTAAADRGRAVAMDELFIDVGLCGDEARERVSPGDRAVLSPVFERLLSGNICAKALDNRLGAALLIEIAQRFSKEELPFSLILSFSAGEEAGLRGAGAVAFTRRPLRCIVIDATFAKTPQTGESETGEPGGGPMIGFSPVLDRELSRELTQLAQESGIPFQSEVMGGTTGTNADVVHNRAGGIKTGLISVPIKNMHTGCEIVRLSDMLATADLLAAYLRAFAKTEGKLCTKGWS